MTRTSSAASLIAACIALAAPPAAAGPGNGIRLGGSEGRLHPYVEIEGRWDSNVLSTPTGTASDAIVHVRPGFDLSVPGERIAIELGAHLDWAQYLGLDSDLDTSDLSQAYGAASLGLRVNRRGAIGLELDDRFRRSPSTAAFVFGGAVVANQNVLSMRIPWRPGGGALTFALTGGWTLETFEPIEDCEAGVTALPCDADLLGDLGYGEVRGGAEVSWRFLPRTSALFEASYLARTPNETALSPEVSGFEARVGVAGLVTPHLRATVKAGYASTKAEPEAPAASETTGTWLATIEAEWLATREAAVRAGWDHGFGVDPGSALSVYSSNRAYAGGRYALAGRYGARLDASWERRAYELVAGTPTADLLRVEPAIEVAISRWMNASVGYAYTTRSSGFGAGSGFDYDKSEAWLRLAFTY